MKKEKVLSVSVAAYNVENFIRNTLDSCVIDTILDDIEVIVVNDGSTDGTKAIVEEFVDSYPDTFKLIDKENEGYGSTVLLGIKNATGKYFKLLDGDDWFDKKGICKLVDELKNTDVDAVISAMSVSDGEKYTCKAPLWSEIDGKTIDKKEFDYNKSFGIWELTVKTELMKKAKLDLPLHCLYTDQIFVMKAMVQIQKIKIICDSVYCYRKGFDEQSSSRNSRKKHFEEFASVYDVILQIYLENRYEDGKENVMLKHRFDKYYRNLIRTFLLQNTSREIKQRIYQAERQIKQMAPEIYTISDAGRIEKIMFFLMRITGYMAYYPIALIGIPNWG